MVWHASAADAGGANPITLLLQTRLEKGEQRRALGSWTHDGAKSCGQLIWHTCSSPCGTGTGKTRCLVKHVCFLIEERNINPNSIFVLTFTRAAAYELKRRIQAEGGDTCVPRISTLHSFALRQLLRNSSRLTLLPQPFRIADDWEERNIIQEDLKSMLKLEKVNEVAELLKELSADWQKLTADQSDWGQRFPNPAFLGAWKEHRQIYGYVLRAELVYQLKLALEQCGDFALEGPASS